ncbi:uncharacterized protein [Dysidea avara]|uniref:uncharacterized protein isoform X2 n=1 Tax=Dysidea avara TaxID=196820 RepID=UPI00332B72EE
MPTSSADYLEIYRHFGCFCSGYTQSDKTETRRFINFVDTLYDNKVGCVLQISDSVGSYKQAELLVNVHLVSTLTGSCETVIEYSEHRDVCGDIIQHSLLVSEVDKSSTSCLRVVEPTIIVKVTDLTRSTI